MTANKNRMYVERAYLGRLDIRVQLARSMTAPVTTAAVAWSRAGR
jgi:hypothetical protein